MDRVHLFYLFISTVAVCGVLGGRKGGVEGATATSGGSKGGIEAFLFDRTEIGQQAKVR